MIALLLAAQLATLPNPILTPGAVRQITVEVVCSTKWGLDRRHVSEAMKKHVAAAYGVPWEDRAQFEFDHLIPRSLGGSDDILDLWVQPLSVVTADGYQMGAFQKDRAEVAAGKAVCSGKMLLSEAQSQFRKDWTVLYLRFVGEFPRAY